MQEVLVAVATRRDVRRRFAHDRAALLADFALTDRERAALLALPLDAIDRYAAGLERKRWSEVARIVPRTLRIVPSLPAIYCRWIGAHPVPAEVSVLSPGASEACRWLAALRDVLGGDGHADYAADLATYEILAAASREDGRERAFASAFGVHQLVRELDADRVPIDPDPAPHAYRFDRTRVYWRTA
jgi:hypothetical protein